MVTVWYKESTRELSKKRPYRARSRGWEKRKLIGWKAQSVLEKGHIPINEYLREKGSYLQVGKPRKHIGVLRQKYIGEEKLGKVSSSGKLIGKTEKKIKETTPRGYEVTDPSGRRTSMRLTPEEVSYYSVFKGHKVKALEDPKTMRKKAVFAGTLKGISTPFSTTAPKTYPQGPYMTTKEGIVHERAKAIRTPVPKEDARITISGGPFMPGFFGVTSTVRKITEPTITTFGVSKSTPLTTMALGYSTAFSLPLTGVKGWLEEAAIPKIRSFFGPEPGEKVYGELGKEAKRTWGTGYFIWEQPKKFMEYEKLRKKSEAQLSKEYKGLMGEYGMVSFIGKDIESKSKKIKSYETQLKSFEELIKTGKITSKQYKQYEKIYGKYEKLTKEYSALSIVHSGYELPITGQRLLPGLVQRAETKKLAYEEKLKTGWEPKGLSEFSRTIAKGGVSFIPTTTASILGFATKPEKEFAETIEPFKTEEGKIPLGLKELEKTPIVKQVKEYPWMTTGEIAGGIAAGYLIGAGIGKLAKSGKIKGIAKAPIQKIGKSDIYRIGVAKKGATRVISLESESLVIKVGKKYYLGEFTKKGASYSFGKIGYSFDELMGKISKGKIKGGVLFTDLKMKPIGTTKLISAQELLSKGKLQLGTGKQVGVMVTSKKGLPKLFAKIGKKPLYQTEIVSKVFTTATKQVTLKVVKTALFEKLIKPKQLLGWLVKGERIAPTLKEWLKAKPFLITTAKIKKIFSLEYATKPKVFREWWKGISYGFKGKPLSELLLYKKQIPAGFIKMKTGTLLPPTIIEKHPLFVSLTGKVVSKIPKPSMPELSASAFKHFVISVETKRYAYIPIVTTGLGALTMGKFKPAQLPKASQLPKLTQLPMARQVPRYAQVPLATQIPLTAQAPRYAQIPIAAQVPKLSLVPTAPSTPMIPGRPFIPLFLLPFKFPSLISKRRKLKFQLRKQPKKYIPSFGAVALGIKAKKIPKTYRTGLAIRPIIIRSKKAKKKAKKLFSTNFRLPKLNLKIK